ncbi:MAG TPA: class I adenylate-forming enzyme family protein, partial [Acidimicrobiia bacterium]|nr:class I adenylate-forming enzyme family protein [Acidimicrobiia bacterium]
MNIAVWVERNARAFPHHAALARGEAVHADWAAFARRTAAVAGALLGDHGCRPGDRVALVMKNSCEYLEALFGIWHAGLVAVPVNAKLHPAEISWILEHSGASTVFTDPGLADNVKAPAMIVAPGDHWARLVDGPAVPRADRRPEDPAWLFYTSGTTGRPKGATLTHRNLLLMSLSYFADIDPVAPADAIFHAAPLSHGSGLYGLPHIARGATNVVPESGGVDAAEIASLLARWQGVSFFAAPTIVGRLLAEPAM